LRQVRRYNQPMRYRFAGVTMNQNSLIVHRLPPFACRTMSLRTSKPV
jgi:hypothetical protein